jgi:hypothetical protein
MACRDLTEKAERERDEYKSYMDQAVRERDAESEAEALRKDAEKP